MTITMTAGGIASGDVVCTCEGYAIGRVCAVSKSNAGGVRVCLGDCRTGDLEFVVTYAQGATVHVERESLRGDT